MKIKAEEAKKKGGKVICSLMMDKMAIKKHVSWDGKKYNGYVDFGNALVFMVVAVDGSWKVPRGYFFIDGLSGKERANLVKVCIQRLSDVGVKVISLTCDGPSCHFSMLSALGASLHLANMIPYFPHLISRTFQAENPRSELQLGSQISDLMQAVCELAAQSMMGEHFPVWRQKSCNLVSFQACFLVYFTSITLGIVLYIHDICLIKVKMCFQDKIFIY